MASTKSGIIDLIVGAAEVASAFLIPGIGPAVFGRLMSAGSGLVLSGAVTLIAGQHDKGFATTTRNPIAPWRVQFGRARVGGTIDVYTKTSVEDRAVAAKNLEESVLGKVIRMPKRKVS